MKDIQKPIFKKFKISIAETETEKIENKTLSLASIVDNQIKDNTKGLG